MNFARPYQEHQRRIAEALRSARARGERHYQTTPSARDVNPSRMTDKAIDLFALREAERYTQRAINVHNESTP